MYINTHTYIYIRIYIYTYIYIWLLPSLCPLLSLSLPPFLFFHSHLSRLVVQEHMYISTFIYFYHDQYFFSLTCLDILCRGPTMDGQSACNSGAPSSLARCATHCSTLQHIATHCNTLQHTATHCNTLQHTVPHCHTLQHAATHCNTPWATADP